MTTYLKDKLYAFKYRFNIEVLIPENSLASPSPSPWGWQSQNYSLRRTSPPSPTTMISLGSANGFW